MKVRKNLTQVVLAALILSAVVCAGQASKTTITPDNATGLAPGQTIGGTRENIDYSVGSLNIQVPLLNLPGRHGMNLDVTLIYDSKPLGSLSGTWDPVQGTSTYQFGASFTPSEVPGGWHLNIPVLQTNIHTTLQPTANPACYQDFLITTADGSSHSFSNQAACANTLNNSPFTVTPNNSANVPIATAADLPTLLLDTSNPADIVLRGKDGTSFHFFTNLPLALADPQGNDGAPIYRLADQIVDVNGNTISITNSNGNIILTDTLGRAVTLGYISGNLSSISYLDSTGTKQTITLGYANNTVNYTFTNPGTSKAINAPLQATGTNPVLSSITFPNGLSYQFAYNGSLGELSKITYPSGGYTRYDFGTFTHWSQAAQLINANTATIADFREVTARHVCRDSKGGCTASTEDTTTYSPTVDGTMTNNQYMDVTDALGNRTRYQFNFQTNAVKTQPVAFFARELFRYAYQGNLTLLLTTKTEYNNLQSDGSLSIISLPSRVTTTLNANNLVSKVEYDYDPDVYDNVVAARKYDYGNGVPGSLIVRSAVAWLKTNSVNNVNYLANGVHILNRKASDTAYDSSNNTCQGQNRACAQTLYEYDSYTAGLSASGAVQHAAAYGTSYTTRGNITAVQAYRSTDGAILTTRNQYDDAGNILSATDPAGNQTTTSYADSWGNSTCAPASGSAAAYPNSRTNAAKQTSYSTFNSCFGTVASTTDVNGQTTSFAYDAMARLTLTTLPADSSGKHPSVTLKYPDGNTIEQLKTVTASLTDDSFSYSDGLGRPNQSVHTSAGGATVTTTYDAVGRVASVTNPYFSTADPTYGVTQTQYDALGRVKQVTRQDGSVVTTQYDQTSTNSSNGNCTTTKDEAGNPRKACSDALGRLVEVDEPGDSYTGVKAQGSLTPSGTLQSKVVGSQPGTQAGGSVSIAGSGSDGASDASINDPNEPCPPPGFNCPQLWDRGWISITVNGVANMVGYGQNSHVNTVVSDLVNAINSGNAGSYVTASPGNFAVLLQAKSAGSAGNYRISAASDSYDDPDFGGPSFTGSPSGATLTGGTDANPGTTVYDAGMVTITIGSFTASAPYGSNNNSTTSQIASALVSSGNPNNLNRSGSPVTAAASGSTLTITYANPGTAGNVDVSCSVSTSQGQYFSSPSFSCPGINLTGGQNPEGPSLDHNYFVTLYSYDALGNLLSVTQKGDPGVTSSSQYRARSFTYDSLSHLLTASNPESGLISFSYDSDGNLLQRISPVPNQTGTSTQTISYCYDALNRVTGKAYSAQTCAKGQLPAGTAAVTYAYDAGTNGVGHLTSLTDQAGTGSYSYDALGRIITEQRTIAGVQKTMNYAYNLDGSIAKLTYPSGAAVAYAPDAAGRPLSAIDTGNNINYVTGATYAPDNSLTGFVSGNSSSFAGITNVWQYNLRLQICRITALTTGILPKSCTDSTNIGNVLDLGYNMNLGNGNNGNVTGVTDYKDGTRSQSFTYDALNRLTSAQNSGTDCTQKTLNGASKYWGNNYSYDAWGNLLQKTITKCSAENLSVAVLANNQLSGYSYDAAGNMIHDATTGNNYSYNQENRITGAAGFTYSYDADGNRVEKSNGNTGTIYWYMSAGVVAESDLTGAIKSEYIFFAGERVARRDLPSGNVSYYFSDHLKTASVITNASGTITEDEDYYPWGGELQFVNNDSNRYKFTGKERDGETGLDDFGARYYSSPLGRFVTPDWSAAPAAIPYANLANPQTLNLYALVHDNPASYADLDGHLEPGQLGAPEGEAVQPRTRGAADNAYGCVTTGCASHITIWAVNLPSGVEYFESEAQARYVLTEYQAQNQQSPTRQQGQASQRLSYTTTGGGPGKFYWEVQWKLSEKAKSGGWIVQHVSIQDPSGNLIYNYWEAWRVPVNSRFSSYHPDPDDDNWEGPNGAKFKGQARFYEGLQLPPSFINKNEATAAGRQLSTAVNPHLPDENATPPVNRVFTVHISQ